MHQSLASCLHIYTVLFTHEEMRKWFDTKANTDDLFQEIFMTFRWSQGFIAFITSAVPNVFTYFMFQDIALYYGFIIYYIVNMIISRSQEVRKEISN